MRTFRQSDRERARVSFATTLSLVVKLVDGYTGNGPIHLKETKVYLEEWPFQPIKKPDGYVVFTDLPKEPFTLVVMTDWYVDIRKTIDMATLDPKEPVQVISLMPSTSYPLTSGMTIVRMRLEDEKGRGATNIPVQSAMSGTDDAVARTGLMKQHAEDLHRIPVSSVTGSFVPGDTIRIINKKTGEGTLHVVQAYSITDRIVTLEQAVQASIPRGSPILPVVFGQSDERGECLLFFRPFRRSESRMMITIGTEDQSLVKEVDVPEGEMYNLGTIRWDNRTGNHK